MTGHNLDFIFPICKTNIAVIMVNEELEAIVRAKFQEGLKRSEIRVALLEEGYDEIEVDKTLVHVQHDAIKQLPGIAHMYQFIEDMERKTDHASPKVVATVLIGCFSVLLGLFGGLYYWLDPLGIQTLDRDKQRETDVIKIRSAVDAYYIAKNSYPAKLEELLPEYLQAVPLDPKSGSTYKYRLINGNTGYELCVTFETIPAQCLNPVTSETSAPMVIVTPTPMDAEVVDEAVQSSPEVIEATPANQTVPPSGGTGDPAL